MSPAQRRRFGLLLAADGAGTVAYCIRAALRPDDPAVLADAAGALLGWTAAALALRSDRPRAAVRSVVAGTTATFAGGAVGVVVARRAGRRTVSSLVLLAAGAALGGAYLRVLGAERPG